jgi:hypothetical protein
MGYRLQMSTEIHDRLADLRDSAPPAALLAGQALAALAEEGEDLRNRAVDRRAGGTRRGAR